MTDILGTSEDQIAQAAALLAQGALVAFPTETVYGLGADARNGQAVAGIYAAKGRPSFNPLIVHVANLQMAQKYAVFDDQALRLAAAFWPGPLTLVLPIAPGGGLSELVTAGLDTVAIRIPAAPVAQALLSAFDGPVAAPSANPSGRISPTRAGHVVQGLSGKIAAVIDAGPCGVGVESTIMALTPTPTLLRAGGLPVEAVEACLDQPVALPQIVDDHSPSAPGQLTSHYAPNAPVRLDVTDPQPDETLLGFGPDCTNAALSLSPAGDLTEAAANLFSCLHKLDEMGAKRIAVSPIPDHGLGRAINDRLRRAAAPRG